MSIINDVLKDLELRSSQFIPIGVASTGTLAASKLKPRQSFSGLLGFFFLMAISLAFWLYQTSIHDTDVVIDSVSSEVLNDDDSATDVITVAESLPIEAITVAESLPTEGSKKQGNQIIGMQFRESNEAISLEFSLREKVVSYLKERSENGIVYHLKDIDSDIVAPVIRDNRWIEQFTMTAKAGGIDINLITVAGVLVVTRQEQLGEEIVWAITLNKLPEPIEIVTVVSDQTTRPVNSDTVRTANETILSIDDEPADIEPKVVKLEIKSRDTYAETARKLERALNLVKQRQYNLAESLLLSLLDSTHDLAARESLVNVYERNRKPDRLNELAKASMKRYPLHLILKTRLAHSLFRLKAYQRVIDFLQVQNNLNAAQLALIGASYQRLDRHEPAANFYRQSLQIEAKQSRNWIALGLSEEHNANLKAALSAYRSAWALGGLNEKLREFVEQRRRILEEELN
jgi:predicted negative regulator of RcsB-dependent stress response